MSKRFVYIILTLSLTLACNDDWKSGGPYLEVYMEDSPAVFESVNIRVSQLEVMKDGNWEPLNYQSSIITITDYTGGKSLKMVSQEVATGRYTKLRMTFSEAGTRVVVNEKPIALQIPEENRIIELDLPKAIEAIDGTYHILCDMDVAKSITPDTVSMIPHVEVIDLDSYGAISGSLKMTSNTSNRVEVFRMQFEGEDGSVNSTYSNRFDSKFFKRLPQGRYDIRIFPAKNSAFRSKFIEGVKVDKGGATLLGKITLDSIPVFEKPQTISFN